MPWTAKDAKRHKKGLSPSQAKEWAKVANSVLASCQKEGGKDCEGKAIRVANSKFSESMDAEIKTEGSMGIPKGALRLIDPGVDSESNTILVFKEGDIQKKKLQMTVYSGKVLKDHWYWGSLAIDLSGAEFPKKKYPVLEDHRTDRKIAFTSKPLVDEKGLHVNPDKTEFVDTVESNEFQKLSEQGFPFEASLYGLPSVIERIDEGASVQVNGYTLKGPGSVWRKWTFKEASVCVFGHDTNTQSSSFSRTEKEDVEFEEIVHKKPDDNALSNTNQNEGGEKTMDLKELKEKHPELVQEIVKEAKTEVEKQFSTEVSELKIKNTNLGEKVLDLEKRESIRGENERKLRADFIWNEMLLSSDIPESLYEKVKPHVSYSKFVENGVFDEVKFKEAITNEIKDWVGKGAAKTVMGVGYQTKDVVDSQAASVLKQREKDDQTTNMLLNLAGVKTAAAK